MQNILSVEQMRLSDSYAINELGVPGTLLMENAARSSYEFLIEIFHERKLHNPKILICCGSGNNGGDGFALARHLCDNGDVTVMWIGSEEKMSPETKNNFQILKKLNIPLINLKYKKDLDNIVFNAECIIDSMIGVGGSENIKGLAGDLLLRLQDIKALKIAIDVPTGLNSDTGALFEFCFIADYTITMFAIKQGMLFGSGPDVCGKILIAGLGVPKNFVEKFSNKYILERDDIDRIIPKRKRISSKSDYGKVLFVAGSTRYPGAAALCSNAAIKSGAGLVYLYSTVFHASLLPEVIPIALPSTKSGSISFKAVEQIVKDSEKADSLIIGPGLSDHEETIKAINEIVKNIKQDIPIIIDADGLRFINDSTKLRKNIIITPHCGEFSRITGLSRAEIENNTLNLSYEWSNKLNCTILLKHIPTIITDGEKTYININGNPGMASGGSGDVLSGIIGGLLAQKIEPLLSAALGAFIHALAADLYRGDYNMETLTASSILEYLPQAFKR